MRGTPETGALHSSKAISKPSTFVKFVIRFESATNPTYKFSLCSPHNHIWQG